MTSKKKTSNSSVLEIRSSKSTQDEQMLVPSSSISSELIVESKTILNRTIRSFGLLLCSCLFFVNSLRIGLFLLPMANRTIIEKYMNLCLVQSFLLHVLSLFHLNLTIAIRLFWHYCFLVGKYWQKVTLHRLLICILGLFIGLCLFTWPSLSDEWGSIKFDPILRICIVNYQFHWSYTFFVLSFTCLIPYSILIVSHRRQIRSIDCRIEKYFTRLTVENEEEKLRIIGRKIPFLYASYSILIWSLINIGLIIGIHMPCENEFIRYSIYYSQMGAFLLDPLLYIFIFRSLSIITLLRPTSELDL